MNFIGREEERESEITRVKLYLGTVTKREDIIRSVALLVFTDRLSGPAAV